jgi:hypothetical protein
VLPRKAAVGGRAAGPVARALRALAAAALCAAAVLGTGCGAEEDVDQGDGKAATELTVTLDPDGPGGDPERSESIVCDQGGGGDGCAHLDGISAEDLEPVPPDALCTQIYGGPDRVQIEGILRGEPISAWLTRANGCEIARFERFAPLLRSLFPDYEPGEGVAPPG